MTHVEILAAVIANPELAALIPNTQAIADALPAQKSVIDFNAGIGTILSVLGPVDGPIVLNSIESLKTSNPAVKWGWYLIERSDLNFGDPVTRAMIDSLVSSGVFSAEIGNKLKSIAETESKVSEFDVRCALLNNDGTWRV